MTSPRGILIFGANGSGKTTLAREVAHRLGYRHLDHEEYAFAPSEIPYTNPRSLDEQVALLTRDIQACNGFVLSAVTGDFGAGIVSLYGLAVLLDAPLALRLHRVEQRGMARFGDRARQGGNLYAQQQAFISFVANRSVEPIETWAECLSCPVVRMDGKQDYRQTAAEIVALWHETETGTCD